MKIFTRLFTSLSIFSRQKDCTGDRFVNIQYFPLRNLRIYSISKRKMHRMIKLFEHPLSQYADPAFDILSNVSFL